MDKRYLDEILEDKEMSIQAEKQREFIVMYRKKYGYYPLYDRILKKYVSSKKVMNNMIIPDIEQYIQN